MTEAIRKNIVIVDSNYPGGSTCNVREYREGDAAALAAGRVFSHELPLSGEWQEERDYEWGHQKALCFARWNKATGKVQIVKAHGPDEDLRLDKSGNLFKYYWNPGVEKWEPYRIKANE